MTIFFGFSIINFILVCIFNDYLRNDKFAWNHIEIILITCELFRESGSCVLIIRCFYLFTILFPLKYSCQSFALGYRILSEENYWGEDYIYKLQVQWLSQVRIQSVLVYIRLVFYLVLNDDSEKREESLLNLVNEIRLFQSHQCKKNTC